MYGHFGKHVTSHSVLVGDGGAAVRRHFRASVSGGAAA